MALNTESLTQEKIEELFSLFRIVNRSHWKTPLLSLVKMQLESKGRYEFKVGLKDKWTQKFVVEKQNSHLNIKLELNENQPPHILEGLKKIKSYFDGEIQKHIQ